MVIVPVLLVPVLLVPVLLVPVLLVPVLLVPVLLVPVLLVPVVLVLCGPKNPSKSPELVNDQIHTRLHWLHQCVVAG
ncbi:hypothetical protein N9Y31_07295 [Alphaproteobacteria bacterium]|nr:hypothetical protein [Alphaproteobacteria bacterium]